MNRSPSSTKKSATKEGKKGWKNVQLEMLKKGKKTSVDEDGESTQKRCFYGFYPSNPACVCVCVGGGGGGGGGGPESSL